MILHITERYKPYIGGSAKRISELLEKQIGINETPVVVMTLDGKNYVGQEEILGVKVIRSKNLLQMVYKAAKLCYTEKVKIVHTHNFRFGFVGLILRCLVFKKIEYIMEMHSIYKTSSRLKEIISKLLYKSYDKIIVLSESSKEKIYKYNSNVYTLINGIDKELIKKKDRDKIPENIKKQLNNKLVFGYIGTLYDWQGTENMLWLNEKLSEIYDNVIFLIIGDGPELEEMKKKSNNIIFIGSVNFHEISDYMELIDVFLILRPSTLATETAIPLKVFEAMVHGKLILASNVGGLTEVLQNKHNAILYEKNCKDDMLKSAKEIVDSYEEIRYIGDIAQEDVEYYPTWQEQANKLLEIYKTNCE